MKCLIGHTGFVGSNLMTQAPFDHCFNSRNIEDISANTYELAVCAGVSATMWQANADPKADWSSIDRLLKSLSSTRIETLVLVSTIAVFDDMAAGYNEQSAQFETSTPYGLHRRRLEEELMARFPRVIILRLPALFGLGLKKNFVFDLLNPSPSFFRSDAFKEVVALAPSTLRDFIKCAYEYDDSIGMYAYNRKFGCQDKREAGFITFLKDNDLDARRFTNDQSEYQFYDLSQLWDDILLCKKNNLREVNIAVEPLMASEVALKLTGEEFVNRTPSRIVQNVRSVYASIMRGRKNYMYSAEETLDRIAEFAAAKKSRK